MRNPFKELKEKKEAEKMAKEAAEAARKEAEKKAKEAAEAARKEAEAHKRKKWIIAYCALLVGLAVFTGIMTIREKRLGVDPADTSLPTNTDSVAENLVPTVKPEATNNPVASEPSEAVSTPSKSINGNESTIPPTSTELQPATNEDVPYKPVKSFGLKTLTDYAHIDSETICLGNNEGVTITLTASPSGLSTDDFLFYYDESMLSVNISEAESDTDKNRTTITIVAHAIIPGISDFLICSSYEIETLGEQAKCYQLSIKGLDYTEGRIVYVTSGGEKYHLSKECAGDNYIETTMRDALAYEYEPCGKCAK